MNSKYCLLVFPIIFFSCTHGTISFKNEKRGKLTSSYYLTLSGEKKILLDYETAPKPPYMQMIQNNIRRKQYGRCYPFD